MDKIQVINGRNKWGNCFNNKIILSNYNLEYKLVLKNQLDEEIHMNHCLQSAWDFTGVSLKQHKQSRQGDWICVRCNNLNFSFRKRCNRCKGQTREQNEAHIRQAYQFYHDYYHQLAHPSSPSTETSTSLHSQPNPSSLESSPRPSNSSEQGLDLSFEELNLPSVSPIIKRYNKEKWTPKTQISQGTSSDEEVDGMEYLNEYCWQNVMAEEDLEGEYWAREGVDYWDVQIEKIVQNIVL